ncbi:hypothetical protein [Sphingomonas oryzagri]|uniref:DNA transfer protein n=1 Tax=Sphingomonas oryzagri TaxID=3042314 RepID=A0ABT6N123_9SPHN|nr:hypothetical protein [Sphingomonas oryzagri]MDH7638960.1 hypothetical protein [Sphingomonas oryzagri]
MATAAISAGASILGGIAGGKGASKAAKIQAAAYQKGIDEQSREFGITQQNEAPYLSAGNSGLTAYLNLLGLGTGGATGQQSAIDQLKTSPLFTSLMSNGTDSILANAAATGGLRGGNTQDALSRLGTDTLSSVIQNQLSNYGSLINTGQAAVAGQATAGQNYANAVSNLYGQQGSAQATAAAAPYAAAQGIFNQLGGNSSGLAKAFGW